jgi:hypothetical protein
MKPLFNKMNVSHAEYYYFDELNNKEKVRFLLRIFEQEQHKSSNPNMDLTGFFSSLNNSLDANADPNFNRDAEDTQFIDPGYENDPNRIDILIDDNNIMIESNSLKAVRHIIYRFVESGYILRRDMQLEKMFKRDKLTKYLRIFSIVNQTSSICVN